jgi:hypothetical protein
VESQATKQEFRDQERYPQCLTVESPRRGQNQEPLCLSSSHKGGSHLPELPVYPAMVPVSEITSVCAHGLNLKMPSNKSV